MPGNSNVEMRVGVAGLGAIGLAVARRLDDGIPGLRLAAVAGRDLAKTQAAATTLSHAPKVVPALALPQHAEVVVDCAPSAAFDTIAEATMEASRILLTVNAAALLRRLELVQQAQAHGGRIIVASGALLGLDAVVAAAEGRIDSIRMVTRKPPAGLRGAPYLAERGITLENLTAPVKVFEGSAGEGALGFPANVNVAAALSLAGIGPERTRLEIWADPGIDRNIQAYEVEADCARFSVSIENVPSQENPRTGRITALSVIAALRRLVSPLVIGT